MLRIKDEYINLLEDTSFQFRMSRIYSSLSWDLRKHLETLGIKEIQSYSFRVFLSTYTDIADNLLFSKYPIRIIFDSELSPYPGITNYDTKFIQTLEKFWILEVKNKFILVDSLEYFEKKHQTDYYDTDLALIGNSAFNNNTTITPQLTGISLKSIAEKKKEIYKEQDSLKSEMKNIQEASHNDLVELKAKMDAIKKEMTEKQALLMAELEEKKLELNKKRVQLEKELAVLDARIYDIKSFMGESYELIKIRDGKGASKDEPFVISQKLRYLNEDLPILIGLFNDDLHGKSDIISALKYSDMLVDYFCVSDKSITFFRLSRTDKVVDGYETINANKDDKDRFSPNDFLRPIINERGYNFVGFLVKNGEQLFLGVVDEGRRIIVTEDVFLDLNAPEKNVSTSASEKLARKFIFSIIQGLIENKDIIQFNEEVNIFNLPPEIIFSASTGTIKSNQFGSFRNLKEKINKYSRANDNIYILQANVDTDRLKRGFTTYTPRVSAVRGMSVITEIFNHSSGKQVYISTERESITQYNNTSAKYEIYSDEYVILDYLNSKWIEYFISNKETDDSISMGRNFYEIVKHYMTMRDYLLKRELDELRLIKNHYPEIESIYNWQVLLSEWKLQQKNPVRNITDYQARRFVNAIKTNEIKKMDILYSDNEVHDLINPKWFFQPLKQLKDETYALLRKKGSFYPEYPLKNVKSKRYHYYSNDILEEFVQVMKSRETEKIKAFDEKISKMYNEHSEKLNDSINENFASILNEISNMSKKFNVHVRSKKEFTYAITETAIKLLSSSNNVSNDEIKNAVEIALSKQDILELEFDLDNIKGDLKKSFSRGEKDMSYIEFKRNNPDLIYAYYNFSDMYYPRVYPMDKEYAVKFVIYTAYSILIKKYYDAVNEVNSLLYYRNISA